MLPEIGAIARPGEIRFTDALPKTRSGKIMRRLLRDLAAGKEVSGEGASHFLKSHESIKFSNA